MSIIRRIIGVLLILAAILGLVVSIGAMYVIWTAQANLTTSLQSTIDLLGQTLETTAQGLVVTQQSLQSSVDLIGNLQSTVETTAKAIGSTNPMVDEIARLMKEDLTHSYSMTELAEYVNLSPTRLVHLFKEEVGVPIRRFRQWHRMRVVAALIAKGDTLTDAALGAGFADSSHFSRAFRNMFGITPSSVFGRAANVRIVIA